MSKKDNIKFVEEIEKHAAVYNCTLQAIKA